MYTGDANVSRSDKIYTGDANVSRSNTGYANVAGQTSHMLTPPAPSPSGSPTKNSHSSPTSGSKHVRPRAKSVETDPGKRVSCLQLRPAVCTVLVSCPSPAWCSGCFVCGNKEDCGCVCVCVCVCVC